MDAWRQPMGRILGTKRITSWHMDFMASEYAKLGLEVRRQPVDLPPLWALTSLSASYGAGDRTRASF